MNLKLTVTKSDKVAAYSEPQVGCPSKVEELTELLKHMGNQSITITGLAQRQLETRITRE